MNCDVFGVANSALVVYGDQVVDCLSDFERAIFALSNLCVSHLLIDGVCLLLPFRVNSHRGRNIEFVTRLKQLNHGRFFAGVCAPTDKRVPFVRPGTKAIRKNDVTALLNIPNHIFALSPIGIKYDGNGCGLVDISSCESHVALHWNMRSGVVSHPIVSLPPDEYFAIGSNQARCRLGRGERTQFVLVVVYGSKALHGLALIVGDLETVSLPASVEVNIALDGGFPRIIDGDAVQIPHPALEDAEAFIELADLVDAGVLHVVADGDTVSLLGLGIALVVVKLGSVISCFPIGIKFDVAIGHLLATPLVFSTRQAIRCCIPTSENVMITRGILGLEASHRLSERNRLSSDGAATKGIEF